MVDNCRLLEDSAFVAADSASGFIAHSDEIRQVVRGPRGRSFVA